MDNGIPRLLPAVAFVVALVAAAFLGLVIGSNLQPAPIATAKTNIYDITLIVQANLALGPDNRTHDAFVPCNFTFYSGQTANLTIVNFDDMPHSFTSPTLNVDFHAPGSLALGVPSVSHFQFSGPAAGSYRWWCAIPCDSDAGGWAMTTGNDGQPGQVGFMGGYVTVLPS